MVYEKVLVLIYFWACMITIFLDSQISSPNDGSSSTARDPISIPTTLQANTGMKVSWQLINDEKLWHSINKHAEENILLRKSLQDHNIDKRVSVELQIYLEIRK